MIGYGVSVKMMENNTVHKNEFFKTIGLSEAQKKFLNEAISDWLIGSDTKGAITLKALAGDFYNRDHFNSNLFVAREKVKESVDDFLNRCKVNFDNAQKAVLAEKKWSEVVWVKRYGNYPTVLNKGIDTGKQNVIEETDEHNGKEFVVEVEALSEWNRSRKRANNSGDFVATTSISPKNIWFCYLTNSMLADGQLIVGFDLPVLRISSKDIRLE